MQTPQLPLEPADPSPPRRQQLRSTTLRQRGEVAGTPGCSTKSITDYFKPVQNSSERIVLGSQLNGEVSSEPIHLAVSNAERLKISSPARKKRKLPCASPSKSPVIEAFLRGVKQEKLTAPNSLDSNHLKCHETLNSPKTVMRSLLSECSPSRGGPLNDSLEKQEGWSAEDSGFFTLTHSPEQQAEGEILGEESSDFNMCSPTSETGILTDRGRGFGKLDNIPPWHQKVKSFRKSHNLVDVNFQISVGQCHTDDRKNLLHKSRMEQKSLSSLTASFLELNNLSSQENGSPLRNGPSSQQLTNVPALGTSPCIRSSDPGIPSPQKTFPLSEPFMIKSNFLTQTYPHGKMSSGVCSHKSFGSNSKKKRSCHLGLQSTRNSEEPNYDCYLECSEGMTTTKDCCSENGLSVSNVGVQNLKKASPETAPSVVSLKNEQARGIDLHSSYSMQVSAVPCKYCYPNNCDCSEEVASSDVYPLKRNKLTVSSPRTPDTNSTQKLKPSSNSQSPVDLQLGVFLTSSTSSKRWTNCAHASCPETGTLLSAELDKNSQECVPFLDVAKSTAAMDVDGGVCSQSTETELSSISSPSLSQKVFSDVAIDNRKSNGKYKYASDSDENFECNLDSDEEDDILKPLEEIMQISSKPPAATPEKASFEVFSSQESITPSKPTFTVCSPVAYTNSLDRLLKEKEDSKSLMWNITNQQCESMKDSILEIYSYRLDDLEKKLKGDLEQGMGIFCPFEEEDTNTDEDGPLLDEHRAFIQRFSVVTDAIPDLHPGEEIFHLSDSGKLFSQHTLDLKNCRFIPQREEEKILVSSGKTQQLMLITSGFLTLIYRFVQCPLPILKFLFQMMSVHSDYIVSIQILNTLMDITVANFSTGDEQFRPWIPSVLDVAVVLFNMGMPFPSLFSLDSVQPDFTEADIMGEMGTSEGKDKNQQVHTKQAFSRVSEANIFNVIKFLGLCTAICPKGYKDHEIMQLLMLLFKIRLEKQLQQIPLVDVQCLLENLLKNINEWDVKMPEICFCISELSNHHHNLLKLVHLVPTSVARGRQLRRCLSLVIISKLLGKKLKCLTEDDLQMSVLCQYLIEMKPSSLTKKMMAEEKREQQNDFPVPLLQAKVEQKAYYLTHSLLNLVNEASYLDVCSSKERKFIQELSNALEKHVKCDIREDARLFYKTKVKDLVARIHGKWQEILNNSKPNEGKLHDYWEPVFESQSPTSKHAGQTANATEMCLIEDDMEEITEDLQSN